MTKFIGWIRIELDYEIEAADLADATKQIENAVSKVESLDLDGSPTVLDFGVDKSEPTDQS